MSERVSTLHRTGEAGLSAIRLYVASLLEEAGLEVDITAERPGDVQFEDGALDVRLDWKHQPVAASPCQPWEEDWKDVAGDIDIEDGVPAGGGLLVRQVAAYQRTVDLLARRPGLWPGLQEGGTGDG